MPDYRRAYRPGGTYFFTLVTEKRAPILCTDLARPILNAVMRDCRQTRPFSLIAIALLPDHLHAIWMLPEGDADFSTRWAFIKANFSRAWLAAGGAEQRRTGSRVWNRRRGVWQRRFWEHVIRDQEDFNKHLDYIHYNPMKHGLAECAHGWPYSSFHRWVRNGGYAANWQCGCDGRRPAPPRFEGLDESGMEMGE